MLLNFTLLLLNSATLLLLNSATGFTPFFLHPHRPFLRTFHTFTRCNNLYSSNGFSNDSDNIDNLSGEAGGSSSSVKIPEKVAVVGNPQRVVSKEYSIDSILKELAAINQEGTQNYCILGTRHCSFLHQQIIELLAYALVLSGNHVFTSGSGGTNAAAIRGALRAERQDLLTVVLPQSLSKQPTESQELLEKVCKDHIIEMPANGT